MDPDRPHWFAPKRYGYGSGLPLAWQGWTLIAAYAALVAGTVLLLEGHRLAQGSVIIPATIALLMIVARTTRGGWRWRWGERD